MWFDFWDMHSGGGTKMPPYERIIMEAADRDEAIAVFQEIFGRHPDDITCWCCGSDYSIHDGDSLEQLTAFDRGCLWAEPGEPEGWRKGGRYLERGEPMPDGWRLGGLRPWFQYQTLAQFLANENVRLVTEDEYRSARKRCGV